MFLKKLWFILLIVMTITKSTIAQTAINYSEHWEKVGALEKKGLTQTANLAVKAIYHLAVQDNNEAQQIKCCIFLIKYRNEREEDSREQAIWYVDSLLAKAKAPAKNILQSMQAEMLWQYLQQNRTVFYNTTRTADDKNKNIRTWSLYKLLSTISNLYKNSLNNDQLLKKTSLQKFEPIIIKGQNTRQLRPTLFDFLAHRALEYFTNDEHELTQPAHYFTIADPKAFAPADEFAKTQFTSRDSASLKLKAIELLQQLILFHSKDSNQNALLDADLIRFNFIYRYAENQNKFLLYETALKKIAAQYEKNPGIAQAMYLNAQAHFEKGTDFQPLTRIANQAEIKMAKEICEEAILKFPGTEGAIHCQNLLMQILQPSIQLETEKVNLPNLPFRTLVKYKNVKKIYFRIIPITRSEIKKIGTQQDPKFWESIVSLSPLKNWNVAVPDLQDYQVHSTEIKVDGLPIGMYCIVASLDENFTTNKNILSQQWIYCSNISLLHNNNDYHVVDRETGRPLPNTMAQVWETSYNSTNHQIEEKKAEKYITDENGYFKLTPSKTYRSFLFQLINKDDELFLDENNYNNYFNDIDQQLTPSSFLFTDRSIYRPGQSIYFKGIVLQKGTHANETKILPSFKTSIFLKDANQQVVNELKITTNEFGSYQGSFQLPLNLLNGQFSLFDEATNTNHSFFVEQYKRPTFFVQVSPPSRTYRIFDSITIIGNAKAFAGNSINGASVQYKVTRKANYPIAWQSTRTAVIFPPGAFSSTVAIAHGESSTDENGNFNISFLALPDESLDKNDQPIFNYDVTADVTDISGETASDQTIIKLGYQSMQLTIELHEKILVNDLQNLKIRSSNYNGIFEKATVHLTLYPLQAPDKIFRQRYWTMPDQFVLSKEAYTSYFPFDAYQDEDQIIKWPRGEAIINQDAITDSSGEWTLGNTKLSAGWYKIVAAAKDTFGEAVVAEKFILIQSDAFEKMNKEKNSALSVTVQNKEVAPGQQIKYEIKTGFSKIWMVQSLSRMDHSNSISYPVILRDQPYQNEIIANESDRGGIALNYIFVQHNRVYAGTENFLIPWKNKDLQIKYQTIRNKLLPGSKENWTATISGNQGEKVAAEALVSMYDASLDQFKKHSWSPLDIWPTLSNIAGWNGNGFSTVQFEILNKKELSLLSSIPKSYDRLLPDYLSHSPIPINGIQIRGLSAISEKKVGAPQLFINDANTEKKQLLPIDQLMEFRKNFNETAFFFANLLTDSSGNISFHFTLPQSLTQWKLMTLAHTKDLSSGYIEKNILAQKPLMVQANSPRFMRAGDRMEFSAKISNLSDHELTGTTQLSLLNTTTHQSVDGWFKNIFPTQYFTVAAGQSSAIKFPIEVPFNFNAALIYQITATTHPLNPVQQPISDTDTFNHSKNSRKEDAKFMESQGVAFSDGEESIIPILTNRILVTETFPLNIRNAAHKNFTFKKLLQSGESATIQHQALTMEFSSNPSWYAVQALPYLMESEFECAEQIFNRYYGNTLAKNITRSIPAIKEIFSKWTNDTATTNTLNGALLSNLQKNEELKSVLLQETPWVMDAQNEHAQKKNIAILFDSVQMASETEKAIQQLIAMQNPNGAFAWFKGGPEDRYMTQYILAGIGQLRNLAALKNNEYQKIKIIVDKAIPYLDQQMQADYTKLSKNKLALSKNNLGHSVIYYLYLRSFFQDYTIADAFQKAHSYFREQAKKYWLSNGKYMQAMIALGLHRSNEDATAKAIIKSLKQNAIVNEATGMYWKEWNTGGYLWQRAPIESQSMMIEAFTDIDQKNETINDLKTWLLQQKQTQHWSSTKATAAACYALLLGNSKNKMPTELLPAQNKEVMISLGGKKIGGIHLSTAINDSTMDAEKLESEAGTGYFKHRIEGEKVNPAMGNLSITIQSADAKLLPYEGWGALYWQYFEDLDKITTASTPLQLAKQLFVEKNTSQGPVLTPITEAATLQVGDKIKVRIEIKADRDMEYLQLKDLRAACMEPVRTISGYQFQGGLGYYESNADASTQFFIDRLPRGSYIIEYQLLVTHSGNFSNGIASIQSMYAPAFASHSEGSRMVVENRKEPLP